MLTRIRLRRYTSAQWAQRNTVLLEAEPGYDTTLHRIKIGDGATHWNDLPWAGDFEPADAVTSDVMATVDANAASTFRVQQDARVAAAVAAIAANQARVLVTSVTDTYTLLLTDAGKVIEGNKATAFTITIPPESSVAWPTGTILEVFQLGAGQLTVAGGVGVTVIAPFGAKTAAQYATISLRKRATDTWVLAGDTTT